MRYYNFLATIVAVLALFFANGKFVLSDPCFAYSTLSDASRDINEMSTCSGTDTALYGWYRFTGSAGEKMLDYCPYNYNNFECGAFVKGWLQGRLPETYEGEVYRFVYFAKATNCYLDSRQIKVKNCGAFYIYKLSGVPSYHYCQRYCGVRNRVNLTASSTISLRPTTPASQSMDGCRHYQTLSNTTRAVTYVTNNDTIYHCNDARLYGWYRFMGEAGTRMLDYCPRKPSDNYNTNRCGAFYQGWITSESKPDVNDGEVSRLVCYSDYSTCSCRYQNQIKIRNCGSFFVYWITGIPGCSMTYCGVKDKTAEVTCSQTYMQVKLDRSYFNTSNYYSITLRNPACKASWLPSSKYISIGTVPSACGSTRRDTHDNIIYENEIIMKARQTHASGITRNNDVKLLVRCSYKREGFVSSVSWKPISTINAVEPGFGNFTFYFRMFTGKDYIAAQPYYPVRIKLRDWLYFEAKAEVYDRTLVALLDQCYSTPTMDRNHAQKHSLIEDGCAVDSTVRFINSGGSIRQRFSAQGFKFVNNTAVFVHCIVFICYQSSKEDRCTRGCVGNNVDRARTRRDLSGGYAAQQTTTYSKYYMVDAGPIVFEESPALPSGKLPKGPISTTMLVLIAGVGLLAIIIIVLIVKMRRRDAPQSAAVVKQSKSPVEEIGIDNAPNGKEFVISDEVTSSNL